MSINTGHVIDVLYILLPCKERMPEPKVDFSIGIVINLEDAPSVSLSDDMIPGVSCSPKQQPNKEILCDVELLHYK